MDQQSLMYIMTGAVVVSAIAIVIQLGILFGIYRTAKSMQGVVEKLVPKAEGVIEKAEAVLDQSKKQIQELTSKANEVMDSTRNQLAKVDEVLTEATGRARVQMERIEMVMDDTISRLHETVAVLHTGVMNPLRKASGVIAGVRATVNHLVRGGRPSVAQATSDEEMFI
jgi:ABC-type transporter Mla subunit MlaD